MSIKKKPYFKVQKTCFENISCESSAPSNPKKFQCALFNLSYKSKTITTNDVVSYEITALTSAFDIKNIKPFALFPLLKTEANKYYLFRTEDEIIGNIKQIKVKCSDKASCVFKLEPTWSKFSPTHLAKPSE